MRNLIHLRHYRHHHIKSVAPPPVILTRCAHLVLHDFACTLDFIILRHDVIQVRISLEAHLIIAEQHIIILYPVFILPFRFVVAFRTHPLVILSPCLRILSVFFFPSKEIGFHITGVICRIIPERPCFGGMIFLPGIVHLFNHLPNLLSISFFAKENEGKTAIRMYNIQ